MHGVWPISLTQFSGTESPHNCVTKPKRELFCNIREDIRRMSSKVFTRSGRRGKVIEQGHLPPCLVAMMLRYFDERCLVHQADGYTGMSLIKAGIDVAEFFGIDIGCQLREIMTLDEYVHGVFDKKEEVHEPDRFRRTV